nr:MAG TPA: hypothetical protein [Bacteriophage sp.]
MQVGACKWCYNMFTLIGAHKLYITTHGKNKP